MREPSLRQPKTLDDMVLYRLWHLNARAGRLVMRMCEADFGVTRREWRLMSYLARHDGVLPSELADYAALDRARTSRAVSSLVDKHLVRRQPRPHNRREVVLTLTETGRDLHDRLLPRVAAINGQLMSALSAQEAATLAELLQRLKNQADNMASEALGAAAHGPGPDRAVD
ncbi:MarR family transcriptional regulator [Ottowia sp. GY511]|uniref:MarR family winged helix-turn-helix transcriptional regulator n=1 Tax=Ottowia flava TaxID=2675430 RepID=A0ABW4KVB3_9BURK|nr:MarR family transcriptional regulator [Ottowia sp. GY511]TXK31432.1 MarR family transcriptional regulator [Ottowia sp. GY511]